jgi:hypothetical protein
MVEEVKNIIVDAEAIRKKEAEAALAKFLAAQEEFVALRTTRFLLVDGLELVLRIVSRPVWSRMLVGCGVTAMAMSAQDMKENKHDGGKGLQLRVTAQMEQNRTKIINALIERAGVEVPSWFKGDMLDAAVADQFLDDYALEMLRVGKQSGREEAQMEKFRNYNLLPDDGPDGEESSGDDAEPTDA